MKSMYPANIFLLERQIHAQNYENYDKSCKNWSVFCDASAALAIKLKQVVKVGSRQINVLNRYFIRKTVLWESKMSGVQPVLFYG